MLVPAYEGKKRTPLEAVAAHCRRCIGGTLRVVEQCTDTNCPTYPIRLGTLQGLKGAKVLKSIKNFCEDYCLPEEPAKECTANKAYGCNPPCELWPFRTGTSPYVKRTTKKNRSQKAQKQSRSAAGDGKFSSRS
jgi:hypothetical protein